MSEFQLQSLSNDPIHGYIPFTSSEGIPAGEVSEREIIDCPWLQRLRQIHQLQTAWWVFPAAEHTRFQHVLGVMHLASRAVGKLYPALAKVCEDVPSRGYVETLMRMAGLLHDVGHGPFGHFFDQHYLADFGLTHETLGCEIIRRRLADRLVGVRQNPNSRMDDGERLDPEQICFLITRPSETASEQPKWLRFLQALFCGLYTVDNMDFVLRDAYMSGYSTRAFDLARLLYYTTFTEKGLTIHERGLAALVRFISVRADLFRAIYFHRTVRAIDLTLQDLFAESKPFLFPGNPAEHLDDYLHLTEWSLLVRVASWQNSTDERIQELGERWNGFLGRGVHWKMACERTIFFQPGQSEQASIFGDHHLFEAAVRHQLPAHLQDLPLRFDPARHVHRPGAKAPASGQNFLYDSATEQIRKLDDRELFRRIPLSYRICRIYAEDSSHHAELAAALDRLTSDRVDDPTNM